MVIDQETSQRFAATPTKRSISTKARCFSGEVWVRATRSGSRLSSGYSLVELRILPCRAWRYYRRQGLGATVGRARQLRRYGIWAGSSPACHFPDGVELNDPRGITTFPERPSPGSVTVYCKLFVYGWACSADEVDLVELFVDGLRVRRARTVAGPARRPAAPSADRPVRSERGGRVDRPQSHLGTDKHQLAVARDLKGRCRVAARSFLAMSRTNLHNVAGPRR